MVTDSYNLAEYTKVTDDEKEYILDAAEGFARRGGYFCFEIADVVRETGLSDAVVRGHFKEKQELATALVHRYIERVKDALGSPGEPAALDKLVALWSDAAHTDDQMCLCSLYGAEIAALPPSVAEATRGYYAFVSEWISGTLSCRHNAEHAEAILASLCGALLTVKSMNRPETFETIVWQLIKPVLDKCVDSSSQ